MTTVRLERDDGVVAASCILQVATACPKCQTTASFVVARQVCPTGYWWVQCGLCDTEYACPQAVEKLPTCHGCAGISALHVGCSLDAAARGDAPMVKAFVVLDSLETLFWRVRRTLEAAQAAWRDG